MNKTKPVWRKGAPPAIGWWPASFYRDAYIVRWWNGEYWSAAVCAHGTVKGAAWLARFQGKDQHLIEWRNKWWL